MLANEATILAVGLARRFEGFRAKAYLDCVGVPTIGWGFTHYGDGRIVTLRDPDMLREPADALLQLLMQQTAVSVLRICPAVDTAGRLAALADFAYNLGVARLAASTLRRCANAGDWVRVPAEFRKWRLAGGRILPGLVLRREAEIALI